jgi:predicted Zn-dependent protease
VDEFNIMASHPRTIDRVEAVLQKAQASMVTNGKVARQPYLQQVSGMIYGTDPQEGVFQGQTFLHPKMRIAFTFPQDFKLVNETDHVGGTHSNGSVIVFDVARNLAGGSTMDYLEYDWLKGQPLRDLQTISVNGLAAATGWRQVGSNGETYDARLVAIQGAGDRIYRFIFATPPRLTQALSDSFKRMTYSFRTITDREAAAVVPRTLATHVVTARDTIASLSQNMPHGEYNATMFRVLNDLGETDRLRVGQVVKVVV